MKNRTKYLNVRLTADEYEYLKQKAVKQGAKTLSSYVRDLLLDKTGFRSECLTKQILALKGEINKIGVNINQATRVINSGYANVKTVKRMLDSQQEIKELILKYEKLIMESWRENS